MNNSPRRTPCYRAAVVLASGVLTLTIAGCADTDYVDRDGGVDSVALVEAGGDALDPDASLPDFSLPDGFQLGESVVYAHGAQTLYKVDPATLQVQKVADFAWPEAEADKMTDLAVDADGRLIGISHDTVYAVDAETGACTALSSLSADDHFVGLSFVDPEDGSGEFLVGIDKAGGQVDRIDPRTGQSTPIGEFGDGLLASGDIVSVRGFGTVATVIDGADATTDYLARVDIRTGRATIIGDTGFSKIWGLGYWEGKLYGFTRGAEFILIDVKTGQGTLVDGDTGEAWWGAGVTTAAPVID